MTAFNAKASRAKRPCPIWADAFQRDTQHLSADEIGAYLLILIAMWTRESCDFPDDDNRLARVSRVSTRLWRSRIGPALKPFFLSEGGMLLSKRLRKEAGYVEKKVQQQSDRKRGTYAEPQGAHKPCDKGGENSDNHLKTNDPTSTTDITVDDPRYQPSQQPNNPTLCGGDGSARARTRGDLPSDATFREQILDAIGIGDVTSGRKSLHGATLGTPVDMHEANRWKTELGLSEREILDMIADTMSRKRDGLPSKFSYFTAPMRRLAAAKRQDPLQPSEGDHNGPPSSSRTGASRHTGGGSAHRNLLAGFQRAADRFGD